MAGTAADLADETRFRLNAERVAAKVVDGEAIVINLVNGRYYSLDGASGLAWQLVVSGHRIDEAAKQIATAYDVDESVARADLVHLVADVLDEGLVLQAAEGQLSAEPPAPPEVRLAYARLELVSYTDMEELLALDPPMPGLGALPPVGDGDETPR
jgi:hypothetical protein